MGAADKGTETIDAIRQGWRNARVTPLWETAVHTVSRNVPKGYLWKWQVLRPLVDDAIAVTSMANAERRVLALTNPDAVGGRNTTTNLNACLQVLMPGEAARPHRHVPNAMRFVLEGGGATTIVDGKSCPMAEGDLIITPSWSWHEHVHNGTGPIVWFDALDVPLHQYLGTAVYEPGPPKDLSIFADDAAFAVPNIVPELAAPAKPYSPVFRYPKAASAAALDAAPLARDGSRKIRYVNPLTGGPVMSLLDCHMTRLQTGSDTIPYRTTSNAVCVVVEGNGVSHVGDETFEWGAKDIFSMPHGNWISHFSTSATATLFVVTDREVLRRLDLLKEEYGNSEP
ncbi:MAG TPA: cupin domain-containing protein [Xanthobacteraceae bacterium]|jgi:gentisate 1,2-dioxygenase|nr:cupin domain-containing protein [Xanthobacteraceae bacterium]